MARMKNQGFLTVLFFINFFKTSKCSLCFSSFESCLVFYRVRRNHSCCLEYMRHQIDIKSLYNICGSVSWTPNIVLYGRPIVPAICLLVIPRQFHGFSAIFPRTPSHSFEIWHTCRNCLETNIRQFFYLGQASSDIWACEKMKK